MPSSNDSLRPVLAAAAGLAVLAALSGAPFAQAPVHLNLMIETLARGEVAFGVSNEDLSLENAREDDRRYS